MAELEGRVATAVGCGGERSSQLLKRKRAAAGGNGMRDHILSHYYARPQPES